MTDIAAGEAALRIIAAINRHQADAIRDLVAEDCVLFDAAGAPIKGRGAIEKGWLDYFELMPDYAFRCDNVMESGDTALLAGVGSGTLASYGRRLKDEDHWEVPTAWKVVVEAGLVRELHVYQDNKPITDILGKYNKAGE